MAKLANTYDGMMETSDNEYLDASENETARSDIEVARSEGSQEISGEAEGGEGEPRGNDDPDPVMALVKATKLNYHHKCTLCGTSKARFRLLVGGQVFSICGGPPRNKQFNCVTLAAMKGYWGLGAIQFRARAGITIKDEAAKRHMVLEKEFEDLDGCKLQKCGGGQKSCSHKCGRHVQTTCVCENKPCCLPCYYTCHLRLNYTDDPDDDTLNSLRNKPVSEAE
eukprot:scaffold148988_cov49-Prasinocladus_malaysianus.AAC.1